MKQLAFRHTDAQSRCCKRLRTTKASNGVVSGTAAPSSIILHQGAQAGGYHFNGPGSLGPFSFRAFTSSAPAQKPLGSTCAIYGSVVAGAGVVRSQDGSLLMGNSATGTDCIMFLPTGPVAYCTTTLKSLVEPDGSEMRPATL